jgi:hypothetical protein
MSILELKRTGTLSAIIEHCPPNSEHCYVSEVELCNSSNGSFEVRVKLLNPLWVPLTAQEVLQVAKLIMIHDGIEFDRSQMIEVREARVLIQNYKIKVISEHTLLSSTEFGVTP